MKIKRIDSRECDIIRNKVESKLAEVEQELGINLKMNTIRYNEDGESAGFKVEVSVADATPQTVKDYNRYASICELPLLGTKVKLNGRIFKTAGYKSRSRKKPVIITEVSTGKQFTTSEDSVKRNIIN